MNRYFSDFARGDGDGLCALLTAGAQATMVAVVESDERAEGHSGSARSCPEATRFLGPVSLYGDAKVLSVCDQRRPRHRGGQSRQPPRILADPDQDSRRLAPRQTSRPGLTRAGIGAGRLPGPSGSERGRPSKRGAIQTTSEPSIRPGPSGSERGRPSKRGAIQQPPASRASGPARPGASEDVRRSAERFNNHQRAEHPAESHTPVRERARTSVE